MGGPELSTEIAAVTDRCCVA